MADVPLIVPAEEGSGFLTVEPDSGRVRRWDLAGAAPADLGCLPGWPADRGSGAWAYRPKTRWLAVGSSSGSLHQWDLATRQPLGPVASFNQSVQHLEYGPDGRWLAACGEEGDVGLFDPLIGQRLGPLLTHDRPVLALAFTPDGGELLTVTTTGRCSRWKLGRPQPLSDDQWQTWLEAATGLLLEGEFLIPLGAAEYQKRVAAARRLPTPLAAPRTPAARWHAAEALAAAEAGQFNSACWHLDRWIAQAPKDWLPLARRARMHALQGEDEEARADLARAAALCPDRGLENWKRHQAVVNRIRGRPLPVIEPR
jgi:hypothetical protein